jgi:hypothetical protein
MMTHIAHGLKWLLHHAHAKIVVPIVVAAGLLAYVASLASTPQAARELGTVTQQVWWIVLALTIPYLAARAYVWKDLMQELGLRVPLRRRSTILLAGLVFLSLRGELDKASHEQAEDGSQEGQDAELIDRRVEEGAGTRGTRLAATYRRDRTDIVEERMQSDDGRGCTARR